MISRPRPRLIALFATLSMLIALLPVSPVGAVDNPTTSIFINEIHYDNDGVDEGEAVEVAGPAGTDLSGWSIVLYNGSNGQAYNTADLGGVLADAGDGFGFAVVDYPTNGIQNGSPDGLALIDDGGDVVQFLSYEGTFGAVDGPAAGLTSTDIGIHQTSTTPIGDSLFLTGTGLTYGDFTWAQGGSTFGSANNGQTFDEPDPDPDPDPDPVETEVFFNEIHYDNDGVDTGEAIEVAGPAGTDLSGWSIVLYNGANGAAYDTAQLSGSISDEGAGYGAVVVEYPTNGIQNGSPDGLALVDDGNQVVQFLSYEGVFTASGGPADGLTSTDIGVFEPSTTPIGESLQLTGSGTVYEDFTWTGPAVSSFGCLNAGQVDIAGADCGELEPEGTTVFINEIHYDNDGADTGEAVEVAGPAGIDLSGWSIVLYNGSNGQSYDTLALSGTIDDEGSGYGAVHVDAPGIQNGAPDGLALIDDGNAVIQFLSYEGEFTAVDGPADGVASTDIGVSQSSSTPIGQSLQLTGEGIVYEDFTWTEGNASFGCVNVGQVDLGTSTCGEAPLVAIGEVQGDGATTPLEGQRVRIEGVVVGDYEGPSPNLRGFYVQDEGDGDPDTSDGIFVFHGNEDKVDVGDEVSVVGIAQEFQGQTQLGFPQELEKLGTGASVAPTEVTMPFASADALERYEGMLVTFPQDLYVSEFFQLGRFGQVVVSSGDRLQQPTAVAEPGAAANTVQAANDLNRLILDDALNVQNPDPIIFGRHGAPLTAENTLRGGDTVTGAVGVMTYTWAGNDASGNAYRLRPVDHAATFDFVAQNPRPETPPAVGGSVQVSSFNVLNYFLTLDEDGNQCGVIPDNCRGADGPLELERQRVKIVSALAKIDADVVGLMEMENTPGVSPESDIAQGLNDELGDGTYAPVDAGTVGDDVIRVGMIYKPEAVTPVGEPGQIDYGDGLNRTSLTQTFIDNATGEVFSVVVNHFKSKSCGGATGVNADQGDGQACWNPARVAAAETLLDSLADLGHGDDDWLIIGDLNSYDEEDPIQVLEAAGFVDLAAEFGGDDPYTFVFDGQWGYLDYALASSSLVGQVSGADEYHINADEPSVLDYNTDFKSSGQIEELFAPDEYRASDHDPVVVGLDLDGGIEPPALDATPNVLWPPNHAYRTVEVTAGEYVVEVWDVESSEPDSGLGEDDLPNDIVVVDDDTLQLRAERFSTAGRVYTIHALAGTDGQRLYDITTVMVPHSLGGGPRGLR